MTLFQLIDTVALAQEEARCVSLRKRGGQNTFSYTLGSNTLLSKNRKTNYWKSADHLLLANTVIVKLLMCSN